MKDVRELLTANPIVPVVVLTRLDDTVPLCEALMAGGVSAIEITLRTEAALACIEEAAKRFPDLSVGAGTVMTAAQVEEVAGQGACFGVSPGATDGLLAAARDHALPFLPGGATVSEFLRNADAGFDVQKFFPAEPSGGSAFLKSLTSPLPHLSFCPTGGVNPGNLDTYLALPNVAAVGGSWFVSPDLIEDGRWAEITQGAADARARAAAAGK